MGLSNFTEKCIAFHTHFKGLKDVTTHEVEDEDSHYFSGTVYINRYEFVCIDKMDENKYMVYINNPPGHEGQQWVFGYYKTFGRSLNMMEATVRKREYPNPIDVWQSASTARALPGAGSLYNH